MSCLSYCHLAFEKDSMVETYTNLSVGKEVCNSYVCVPCFTVNTATTVQNIIQGSYMNMYRMHWTLRASFPMWSRSVWPNKRQGRVTGIRLVSAESSSLECVCLICTVLGWSTSCVFCNYFDKLKGPFHEFYIK